MSCCTPKHNVAYCPTDTCRRCTVPTYAFPDQAQFGQAASLQQCLSANGVLSSTAPVMMHDQPFVLTTGTYYEFNGSYFLHLGTGNAVAFTTTPIWPLSEVFYFRVKKYPVTGVDVSGDGTVPYASPGTVVREGDLVMLESPPAMSVLTQHHQPNVYNLPRFGPDAVYGIQEFQRYGTQAGESMRVISETYDHSIPREQQPPVLLDGSKAYFFQFTRTGQSLNVIPGQTPAPCFAKTSEYKGDGTRLIPLAASVFYPVVQQPEQPVVQPVPPPAAYVNNNSAATNGNNVVNNANGNNAVNGVNGNNAVNGVNGVNAVNGANGNNVVNGNNAVNGANSNNVVNGANAMNGASNVNHPNNAPMTNNGASNMSRNNAMARPNNAFNNSM